jgi:hypothetical protein
MRNLIEYPITWGEAAEALQEAQELYNSKYRQNIGGTGGLSLLYAEQFIRANRAAFDEFTKNGPVKQIDR